MVEEAGTNLINHKPHTVTSKNAQNGTAPKKTTGVEDEFSPPDGGMRAWLVMIGSFFCNGILFGVINSYSVLYEEFHRSLKEKGSKNPTSEAALVGSLAMGTTFFVSAVAGVLTDYIGLRRTTFLGGLIAAGGMFLSSFCVDNIVSLCITFGVMYGLGGSLAYTPSLAVLGHYFKRYLGLVNGVVTTGSSVFTIAMPYVISAFLENLGISWTLRLLALIISFIMGFAFLFKPIQEKGLKRQTNPTNAFKLVCKNKKYIIWASVIAASLFGYFVPYVYMLDFVKKNFPGNVDAKLPILCIGITSGVGRLLFGYIADFPWVNRILLQQLAFLSIGVLTMLLSSTHSFGWLIVISLGMGLFDGCFIALLGPIAFDICGKEGATQAIGFLLGICSIPLTIGPYVAGVIYERQRSYTIPMILAGIPPTIGAVAMFLTRCVRTRKSEEDAAQHPLKNSNGTCIKTASSGRLLPKKTLSTAVQLDNNKNDANKRCYTYSIL
ncbi:monocarboxylate transporter 10 [Asbolus verrucosus]|uniref:Monocarboxylate transporter 10 n=1 Tax=Asbolus verrucosus TaxID=1661398 RepID=A0A482W9N6_ASBVE|nr:monocarboxylate transporter 10 [Asbolus verrucosus]